MREYYKDDSVRILCDSALSLDIEPVQCVVTSPPYWGLRKYDGEQDCVWGGDPKCEHEWAQHEGSNRGGSGTPTDKNNRGERYGRAEPRGGTCLLCGAWRGAYGLEPTPEMYVQHTVLFLRAIRDVLKDDGVVFWNVSDSYASGKGSCFNPGGGENSLGQTRKAEGAHPLRRGNVSDLHASGLKPKDLCLIPARVALAAQADGWWVRSDIIWAKPNPMPESVKDRPTSAYEHIFMFTKAATYYWDADAAAEDSNGNLNGGRQRDMLAQTHKYADSDHFATRRLSNGGQTGLEKQTYTGHRNIRDVWTIPTQPSGFKHYAAFPEELPTRCIKAATRPGDTVLDPFCGTGRTLYAALKLGRKAVGVDISETYCEMARRRIAGQMEMAGVCA